MSHTVVQNVAAAPWDRWAVHYERTTASGCTSCELRYVPDSLLNKFQSQLAAEGVDLSRVKAKRLAAFYRHDVKHKIDHKAGCVLDAAEAGIDLVPGPAAAAICSCEDLTYFGCPPNTRPKCENGQITCVPI